MANNIFIFTDHAKERWEERFSELNQKKEMKTVTSCNNDEISHLRRTNAYKNTRSNKKVNIFHFKSKNGVFLVCEKKRQSEGFYAQVVVTVIDLDEDECSSSLTFDFRKEMLLGEQRLIEAGKLSHNDRSKKEKNSNQQSPYKNKKGTLKGKLERAIAALKRSNDFEYLSSEIDHFDSTKIFEYTASIKILTKIFSIHNSIIALSNKLDGDLTNNKFNNTLKELKAQLNALKNHTNNINESLFEEMNLNKGFESFYKKIEVLKSIKLPEPKDESEEKIKKNLNKLLQISYFKKVDIEYEYLNVETQKVYSYWLKDLCSIGLTFLKLKGNLINLENSEDKESYNKSFGKVKENLNLLFVYLKHDINFNDPAMNLFLLPYKNLIKDIILDSTKAIDLIYKKSGAFSEETYERFFSFYVHCQNNFNNELKLEFNEFLNLIVVFQTKTELNRFHKRDVLITKDIVNRNRYHLNEMKNALLEDKISDQIDSVIQFYNVVENEMNELRYDSFYLNDYM